MKKSEHLLFKTILVLFLFAIIAPATFAQKIWGSDKEWTGKETKEEAWRKMIDIDNNVPDFKTKKIDQKVMGWKLAKMIDFIQKTYNQGSYNRTLSNIRYELTEDPRIRFSNIDKMELVSAEKEDSIISLKWKTFTKLNKKEKVYHNIIMTFVNGVSDSEAINNLFSDIARYIKPDEEENEK